MFDRAKAEALSTKELISTAKDSMRQSKLVLKEFRQRMQQFLDRTVEFGSG
jgi:hypothetical protein